MADGNSKRKRRDRHAGRMRGSTIKTGNRGARRTPLTGIELALLGKGQARSFDSVGSRNQGR